MANTLIVGRLLIGGGAAHVHSPAGVQGLNTGIQDMINLGWKLAFVMQGKAEPALLHTYEEDRFAALRAVLTRTESLTGIIGSERPVYRTLFNHLAPWIGGAGFVQDIATTRLSQIALGYRTSSLSEIHTRGLHTGDRLHAGDRLPEEMTVRAGGEVEEVPLFTLLDPSRFVLLAVTIDGGIPAELWDAAEPWAGVVQAVGIAAPEDDRKRARFESRFGKTDGALVVRPDSYIGLIVGEDDAAHHVSDYLTKWLGPGSPVQANAEEPQHLESWMTP